MCCVCMKSGAAAAWEPLLLLCRPSRHLPHSRGQYMGRDSGFKPSGISPPSALLRSLRLHTSKEQATVNMQRVDNPLFAASSE